MTDGLHPHRVWYTERGETLQDSRINDAGRVGVPAREQELPNADIRDGAKSSGSGVAWDGMGDDQIAVALRDKCGCPTE